MQMPIINIRIKEHIWKRLTGVLLVKFTKNIKAPIQKYTAREIMNIITNAVKKLFNFSIVLSPFLFRLA